MGEQGIAGNIERNAKEHVGAALIELAAQPAVCNIELEERVAGRERHVIERCDVPRRDDVTARIRVGAQIGHHLGDLVDVLAVWSWPRTPLHAVDRPEFAVLVGPFVPDPDAVLLEVGDV